MFIIQVVHSNVDTEKEIAEKSNEIMLLESLFGETKQVGLSLCHWPRIYNILPVVKCLSINIE